MKKLIILLSAAVIIPSGLVYWLHAVGSGGSEDIATQKRKAYELYERGEFERSAEMFHGYLSAKPNDAQVTYDYANLLDRLNRNAEAAAMLETYHRLDPKNEGAFFELGVEYVKLQQPEQAAKVFAELELSANKSIAQSAAEAAMRLKTDQDLSAQLKAEQSVYELARQFKYEEVIAAVNQLEKAGDLSFPMAMQRIYSYANLQKYAPAYELAEPLAAKSPDATDLALVRAELLFQLGRKAEAMPIWEKLANDNSNADAARTAENRLTEIKAQDQAAAKAAAEAAAAQPADLAPEVPPTPSEESVIYNLAEKRQYREVIAAIDELGKKRGDLEWNMKMQRLYALQAVGDAGRMADEAGKMAAEKPDSVELAMMQADALIREQRWQEASGVLKEVRDKYPNTPVAKEVDRRLAEVPAMENLDKWNWGESFMSGDYHSRFKTLIGYGYLRTGTYIPHARWLQPYLSFNYVVDTKSGAGARQSIISDNSVGLYGGIRAQLFPTEYLFLYAQWGGNKDLLSRRHGGDWRSDLMVGVYGYKAWGPGVNWTQLSVTNNVDAGEATSCSLYPRLRGDWWVDAGLDFSFYQRFNSWLGYAQIREGLRLMQFGERVSLDAYLMENLAWDAKGNYTDNLFEVGPGARIVWVPYRGWQVVLRAEWAEGVYFGRDDTHQRGSTGSNYGDFRAGLSVGVNW